MDVQIQERIWIKRGEFIGRRLSALFKWLSPVSSSSIWMSVRTTTHSQLSQLEGTKHECTSNLVS